MDMLFKNSHAVLSLVPLKEGTKVEKERILYFKNGYVIFSLVPLKEGTQVRK